MDAGREGHVFWITGLSGVGKTTTALLVANRLRQKICNTVVLDGDELRSAYPGDLGYTEQSRREVAIAHARMCRLFAQQGMIVFCATISLYHSVHRWCRQNIKNYHEVLIRVPAIELEKRDERGLYKNFQPDGVVGVDLRFEEPECPHLIIDNDRQLREQYVADILWQYVCTVVPTDYA